MEASENCSNISYKDDNSQDCVTDAEPIVKVSTDTNESEIKKLKSSDIDICNKMTVETKVFSSVLANKETHESTVNCSEDQNSKSDSEEICGDQDCEIKADNAKNRKIAGDDLEQEKEIQHAKSSDKDYVNKRTMDDANSCGNQVTICKIDGDLNKSDNETKLGSDESDEEAKKREKQGRNLALFAAATKERSKTPDKQEMDTLGDPYNVVRKVSFTLGEGTISLAEHEFLMEKRRKSEANLSDEKYKPPNQYR